MIGNKPINPDERRGSRPRSMVRSFTMPSTPRPLSVASVSSMSSDSTPSRPGSDGFILEPLLPKKMHSRSQDKLDKDETDKEKRERRKEKRNSKHQEMFDKEFKTTDISGQSTEAVILSETISPLRPQRPKSQVLNMSADKRLTAPPISTPVTPKPKLSFSLQPGLNVDLNGSDNPEQTGLPPPLPLKSNSSDYGTLTDSQEPAISITPVQSRLPPPLPSKTPPPPPPPKATRKQTSVDSGIGQ
ncbi:dedicator of cytokinesis protein 1-like [Rhincodon typus]|uniref:dedicator of cytokinesis protein 1-like n=1 Tax=Rhincodon typus TaxID=259920 RepID=UPI00202EBC32|nr:dedicator of cytokinesis protein 1-like [Rhincodon typus]